MNIIHSEKNLIKYARSMSGYNIHELSLKFNIKLPENKKNKGYVGQIIEKFFGLNINNKPNKDFYYLGIELKTIPINKKGMPIESTFICAVPLIKNNGVIWETSYIRYKLSRILWFPIEVNHFIPLSLKRYRVKLPFLWSPTYEEEKKLKKDWDEIMDMIVLGKIDKINSKYGEILYIKNKAHNNKSLTKAIGKYGQSILTIPKGFYLRKNFTNLILINNIK